MAGMQAEAKVSYVILDVMEWGNIPLRVQLDRLACKRCVRSRTTSLRAEKILRKREVVNVLDCSHCFPVDCHVLERCSGEMFRAVPLHCKDGSMPSQPITAAR